MKRREFIKKGFIIGTGSIISAPFFSKSFDLFASPAPASAKPDLTLWKEKDINIAWIGHSTVLINFFGTKVLTDPVLFDRVGVHFLGITIGPGRFTAPALTIDEIPQPDIILLSHAHMDHMDYKTLSEITERYPGKIECLTAYNTKDVIEDLKWKSIAELDWEEEINILDISFKALEVQHFGWRFPWEKDRSKGYMKDGRSFNAYIIEKNGKKILFGGDTAYSKHFRNANLKNIEVAIMPIGAYRPWRKNHCNPEEALFMADEHIKAKYFIPIHCNTFKQGMEPLEEPLRWLNESKDNYNVKLAIAGIGETLTLESGSRYLENSKLPEILYAE